MSVAPLTATATPLVRRIPTRSWDPPYDDELPPRVVIEGSLALAHPGLEPATAPLRLVPAPAPRSALPDPRPWTARLVQALCEVFGGQRPAAQLAPWTSPAVHAAVERRVRVQAGRGLRPVVRSVHVSEPREAVVEACAVIDTGERRRAVALRLEGADGRWRCTALQLG